MQADRDQIFVHFSNEKCLLWNTEDIRCLRSKYRITGSLMGCLPGHSYQNSQLGLPLQLMREEVTILLENKICTLFDFDKKRYETEDTELTEEFENHTKKLLEEYKNVLRDGRIKQIKRKCEEISAGKKKRPRRNESNESVPEENLVADEIKKIPELSADQFPIQLFTRCPFCPENNEKRLSNFKDITSLWKYPHSDHEFLKYSIFKDLWSKGYFITNGFKFGCDYLVYEGDPCICHAKFMIVCMTDKELSAQNVHILGRLSVQVNKEVLLASIDAMKNIVYKSLSNDRLRNPLKEK